MIDLGLIMSIIILNVKCLNTPFKNRKFLDSVKKKSNLMLSTRNTLDNNK